MSLLLFLLLGCGRAPRTLEDCAGVRDAVAQQDCYLSVLHTVFEAGDEQAFSEGLSRIHDPISRDLVRLRLAVESPDRAGWLCESVETDNAHDKCQQVLGRPHLRAPR